MSVSHDEDRYNETHIGLFLLDLAGHFTQHEHMKRRIADRAIACLIDNPPLETDALERELFSLVLRIARDELELRSKNRKLTHESLRADQPAL
jgi:hypothetical protein